jgi:hypothetical protein
VARTSPASSPTMFMMRRQVLPAHQPTVTSRQGAKRPP